MSRRSVTLIAGIVAVIVLGALAFSLPVQYASMGPGVTYNTLGAVDGTQVITIKGRSTNKVTGHLNMTTVSELDHLDLLSAIKGWFSSNDAVVPREVLFPPNLTNKQIEQQATQQFVSSQDGATSAALSYLHYPDKVVIAGLPDDSPAKKKLRAGDAVESLDGRPVKDVQDLQTRLGTIAPGTPVRVGLERGGRTIQTTVTTVPTKGRSGSVLGIQVVYEPHAPFEVTISLSGIGGPSAGLMFALGILQKIGTQDLTGGKFIAGTGTMDAEGEVGPIGGIPLKLKAAKRDGATVFLVPAGNCAEAKDGAPKDLKLIKVSTLSGAVDALTALKQGKSTPAC